jgi:hypothetical protein
MNLDLRWLSDRRNLCVIVRLCSHVEEALARLHGDVVFLFTTLPQKEMTMLRNPFLK